ncbi:MFS transporter [Bartonella apis]|uniref:MFS transporter n=1 Tax=Bartonella apis TaxID=1686310 RepID=UPI00095B67D9|nr:MFS transporter [Bartonella apis]OLY47830.1 metabolite-proton symporter [Bartonella apis]
MSTVTIGRNIDHQNSITQILLASMIGTTIEFFDFYVFATAAALLFPVLFFPKGDPTVALLSSFAIFSAAFFARPLGSIIFGHYGDKLGRKVTLVAALLTMGISTVLIGFLPTYETIGWYAPLLLTLCRFGQGLGLGGEWGGAVLLATENAPKEKRGWYAMFPQLGAPAGLILSAGTFWFMWNFLSESQRFEWGWRIPFIASIILVIIGLWVRLSISETPEFKKAVEHAERVKIPLIDVFVKYPRALFLGSFAGMTTFVLFYLCSAYLLSYSTHHLNLTFGQALEIQMVGAIFFGLLIPFSGKISDRIGRRTLMIWVTIFIGLFSFSMPYLLDAGVFGSFILSAVGLGLMGLTYGPIGAALASPFPTTIRYTGASMTFNLAGIVGASFAPYIAETLVQNFGTAYIGYYLLLCSFISLTCFVGFTDKEISR